MIGIPAHAPREESHCPPPRPTPLSPQPENLPRELVDCKQWVFWNYIWKEKLSKWDKPPYGAGSMPRCRRFAKSNDPTTWMRLDFALQCMERCGGDGIGFVTWKSDPYTIIDLDGCVNPDTKEIAAWAEAILDVFSGTYAEYSPSAQGIRIVVRGKLPLRPDEYGRKKKLQGEHCEFEAYDGNKYYTMTGHLLPGRPSAIADRQEELTAWFRREFPEPVKGAPSGAATGQSSASVNGYLPADELILAKAKAAKNGEKFRNLFEGQADTGQPDLSEYNGDDSAADRALLLMLAFWCRKNPTVMERLYRASRLMRPKFDEPRGETTWGRQEIDKAIGAQETFYDWPTKSSEKANVDPIRLNDKFSLQPVQERRTQSGKLVVQTKLMAGEQSLVLLEVTSAVSSQDKVVEKLAKYIAPAGVESELDLAAIVGKLICDAQERLERAEAARGADRDANEIPTVREIVVARVPSIFRLAYATEDGRLWSESKARAVSRQEFVAFTPEWLVDRCGNGRDAPADENSGEVDELRLVRMIQTSLGILWASLMERLPRQAADAELDAEAEDAKRFRNAVLRLWCCLTTHQTTTVRDGKGGEETTAARASLASRVQHEFARFRNAGTTGRRAKWMEVQNAFAAWWRPHIDAEGRIVALLAMKFILFDQLRIAVPGVTDQGSMRTLGVRYGIFTDTPLVSERLTDGSRLCGLSATLVDEILAQPAEDTASDEKDHDIGGKMGSLTPLTRRRCQ